MRAVRPVHWEANVLETPANQIIGLITYLVTVKNVLKNLVKTVMMVQVFVKIVFKGTI